MSFYYYFGPDARITPRTIESRKPINQSFLIADLRHVHTAGSTWAHPQVGACSTGLTGVCTALATADDVIADHTITSLGLMGAAILAAAVAGAWWSARRRPLELRAVYRGQMVCVYETYDRLVFGQIERALRRAIEDLVDRMPR